MSGSADGLSLRVDQFTGAFFGTSPEWNGAAGTTGNETSFKEVMEQLQTAPAELVQQAEGADESAQMSRSDQFDPPGYAGTTRSVDRAPDSDCDAKREADPAATEPAMIAPIFLSPLVPVAVPDPEPQTAGTNADNEHDSGESSALGAENCMAGKSAGESFEATKARDGNSDSDAGRAVLSGPSIGAAPDFTQLDAGQRNAGIKITVQDKIIASSELKDDLPPKAADISSRVEDQAREPDPAVVTRSEPADSTSGYRSWTPLFSNTGLELRLSQILPSESEQRPLDGPAPQQPYSNLFRPALAIEPARAPGQSFTATQNEESGGQKEVGIRGREAADSNESRTEHDPVSAKFAQTLLDRETGTEVAPVPKAPSRELHDPMPQVGSSLRAVSDQKVATVARPGQNAAPQTPETIFQIAEKIKTQFQNGQTEIRIQLKPEALGRMEIHAESGAQGVVARIITESAGVKNYLESNLQMLQQSLADQGLKVDRIDFIVQDALDGRMWGGQQQAGEPGAGQNGGDFRGRDRAAATAFVPESEIVFDPMTIAALGPNSTFHTVA